MSVENFTPRFNGKNIWMYWPGKKACEFAENVEKGFMACGLPEDREVGDLNELMRVRGALDLALKEAYDGGNCSGGKKLLAEFANMMREGDFVIARNEFSAIVGIGIVAGDYYYDPSRKSFRHCRKVQWIDTEAYVFPDELKCSGKWHRVTLIERPFRRYAEQLIKLICADQSQQTEQ